LNGALTFDTALGPRALHAALKRIERELGRTQGERWGARPIDLDLLLYDGPAGGSGNVGGSGIERDVAEWVIVTPELQVPHPRLSFRRFVLEPAAEIAPEMLHPVIGWSIEQLLEHLNHAEKQVLVMGLSENQPVELAQAAAARLAAEHPIQPVMSQEIRVPPDPSGLASRRPIQFLDRVVGEISAARRPGELVIGAWSVDIAAGEQRPRVSPRDAAWPPSPEGPAPLQLLVLLDDWEAYVAARRGSIDPACDPQRQMLLQMAARDYQGPVLCAGRTDRAAQLTEITAALIALG
jgi:2-amino-4-hydroxy-6-hydroxymethyldihydropteridine diphosphokinase